MFSRFCLQFSQTYLGRGGGQTKVVNGNLTATRSITLAAHNDGGETNVTAGHTSAPVVDMDFTNSGYAVVNLGNVHTTDGFSMRVPENGCLTMGDIDGGNGPVNIC